MENVNPGDILRIAGHVGVVIAVYRSDEHDKPVLRVDFVKNATRQHGSELVDLSMLPERVVSQATVDDLMDEWLELRERQARYVDGLVRKCE